MNSPRLVLAATTLALPGFLASTRAAAPMKTYPRNPVMNTSISKPVADAVSVSFTTDALVVTLADGRQVSAPLEWFPRLRDASAKQRRNWRLIGGGVGIHWEDIDEDIAVKTLLAQ